MGGGTVRVAIYARVSRGEQSPELQLRELRDYAGHRGFDRPEKAPPARDPRLESVREITELFVSDSAAKAALAQSPHVGPMSCADILSTADLPRTFGPQ